MSINSQETIRRILDECKTIAVVGLSSNTSRASNSVAGYMRRSGYHVIPVNPNETSVFGDVSYPDLFAVPEKVDLVDVFRRSDEAGKAVDQAIAVGAKAVWLQEGVIDRDAAQRALDAGLLVVMDRCWLKGAHPRAKVIMGNRAVVITVSDACSRGEREDTSGAVLVQLLTDIGAEIVDRRILSDDLDPLVQSLKEYADRDDVNLIVTTGGTGLGPRDNTPEATKQVIEREAPGIAEAIRAKSLKVTPMAMLSRGVCGVRAGTLIVNLPGSLKAVKESFEVIAPVLSHALDLLAGQTAHRA